MGTSETSASSEIRGKVTRTSENFQYLGCYSQDPVITQAAQLCECEGRFHGMITLLKTA